MSMHVQSFWQIRGRCCNVQEMETVPECDPQEISSAERVPDEDIPDQEFDPRECNEALAQLGLENSGAVGSVRLKIVLHGKLDTVN